jgi:agmatinase
LNDDLRARSEVSVKRETNFGAIPSRSGGDPASARVVLLRAPFEGTVSYGKGASRGPRAILEASRYVETYDEETGLDLEDLSFAVGSEIAPERSSAKEYAERVREEVKAVLAKGKLPFLLGGEHSVSIGAIRAVRAHHPGVHVLSIDAHADLRETYEGSDHSHACASRRALEGGPVTIVAVRSYSREEASFAAGARALTLVPAREAMRPEFRIDELVSSLGELVYITFDVDGLDPAVVPATGTPEPGGLDWFRALEVLRQVFAKRSVVGMDVVELAPAPGSTVSDFAVARLVAKMLCYEAEARGTR